MTAATLRIVALVVACVAVPASVLRDDPEVNADARAALVYAIVDHGTVAVDRYVEQQPPITEDLARAGGHFYVAKPPLPSLLAVPAYAFARAFSPPSDMRSWGSRWLLTVATSGIAFAITVIALRSLVSRLGADDAAHGAVAVALGTPLVVYASMFMGHVVAAALLLVVVDAAVRRDRTPLIAGLAFGALFSTELLIAFAAAVPFVLLLLEAARRRDARRDVAMLLAGAAVGVMPLVAYLTLAFGSPLANMYAHLVPAGPGAVYAAGALRPPQLDALAVLLLSPQQGLVVFAPLTLFGAWRARVHLRRGGVERRAVLVCGATAGVGVVALSCFALWYDGAQYGPRYLVPFIPLLAWPIAMLPTRERVVVAVASALPQLLALVVDQPLLPGTAIDTSYLVIVARAVLGLLEPSVLVLAVRELAAVPGATAAVTVAFAVGLLVVPARSRVAAGQSASRSSSA